MDWSLKTLLKISKWNLLTILKGQSLTIKLLAILIIISSNVLNTFANSTISNPNLIYESMGKRSIVLPEVLSNRTTSTLSKTGKRRPNMEILNRKRDILAAGPRKPNTKLPLEKLFPKINATEEPIEVENQDKPIPTVATPILHVNKSNSNYDKTENKFPTVHASNNDKAEKNSSEPQINLTSALLNHSIHHYHSDDDLDRLVFSKLPQGSKLILRTVKVMKTDENGNEQQVGDRTVSLDVLPVNVHVKDLEEEEVEEPSEDDDEEEYEYDDVEEVAETGTNDKTKAYRSTSPTGPNGDLASDASSHHTEAGYQNYGKHDKTKTKKQKYHHGQDHGKEHKKTLTDTQGKKVTNYKGKEAGLTDFDHAHGNAKSNEGERFKNSKKKNKGRKVTGFKRVYHKEEFQRTEHFYDDEEAKKIAESYGLAGEHHKSAYGKEDDDRKFKGNKIAKTDGEKVKNEHTTKNAHNKGVHTSHENKDKHSQSQQYHKNQQQKHYQQTPPKHHYAQSSYTQHEPIRENPIPIKPHPQASPPYQHPQRHQPHQQHPHANYPQQPSRHPNHNYQAAYSIAKPLIYNTDKYIPVRESNENTNYPMANALSSSILLPPKPHNKFPVMNPNKPMNIKYQGAVVPQSQRDIKLIPLSESAEELENQSSSQKSEEVDIGMMPPEPFPDEIKIFRAARDRKTAPQQSYYYAPNFGPELDDTENMIGSGEDKNLISEFYNKMGNASDQNPETTPKMKLNLDDRYARNYPAFDTPPTYYSTITKTTNDNKDKDNGQRPLFPQTLHQQLFSGQGIGGNLISVDKAKGTKVAQESYFPPPPDRGLLFNNQYANWSPISSGSSNSDRSIDPNNHTIETSFGPKLNITSLLNITDTINHTSKQPVLLSRPFPTRRPHFGRPPQGPSHYPRKPLGGPNANSHYYGNSIRPINPHTHEQNLAAAELYPARRPPTFSNFMNGLMSSVSEFFTRLG